MGCGTFARVTAVERNNVRSAGSPDGRPVMFAHGFGCDQRMWRSVIPAFTDTYHVVGFDHVGFGGSDASAFDASAYGALDRYADDVLEIIAEMDLRDLVFVGHSVSAMIGVLASIAEPGRIAGLVMVCPSPRYIDDDGYVGGFSEQDIGELLRSLDSNYLGWSGAMAPVIMGNPDRPELSEELRDSFCRVDPVIARHFARITFLSDNRADLERVAVPTLILQSAVDAIAPPSVGTYVAARIPGSELSVLEVTGHCPHLSDPALTAGVIRGFVDRLNSGS